MKKAVKNAPDMQVTLPRCMNAMAIHCGAPITATRLSPIMYSNGDQLERAVSHTHGALPVGQQRAGTAQAKGDGPLV